MPTLLVECSGLSGQTTATAHKRNDAATGTVSTVAVVEQAAAGLYWVTLTYADAGTRPLGDWAIVLGSGLGTTLVTLVSTETLYTLSGVDSSAITGGNAVTITVEDDADDEPIEAAKVRVYRSGQTETKLTDGDGEALFGLDTATWSYAITADGYGSATGTLVVDGDETLTVQLTLTAVVAPDDPALATLSVLCVDEFGAPEPDVTIHAKISRIPDGGTGYAYDGTVQDAVSDGDGVASLTVIRLATYLIKRGTSKEWTSVVIANVATTDVKSFVGSP